MPTYTLGVRNWKSDNAKTFFIRKQFPSAYLADRYAMRISFEIPQSQYLMWLVPEENRLAKNV